MEYSQLFCYVSYVLFMPVSSLSDAEKLYWVCFAAVDNDLRQKGKPNRSCQQWPCVRDSKGCEQDLDGIAVAEMQSACFLVINEKKSEMNDHL